jgi:GR25 family glycosyltransferase involved in LPS biosynthesis
MNMKARTAFRLPAGQLVNKAFYINLDRRPDRRQEFMARFPFSFGDVSRISAVDGRTLNPSTNVRHLFRGNDFKYRLGEMGVALSHLRAWDLAAAQNGNTWVLEDDAHFHPNFSDLWNDYVKAAPLNFDILYLGGKFSLTDRVLVRHIVNDYYCIPDDQIFSTHSYIVSPKGASKLRHRAVTCGVRRAVDWFIVDQFELLEVFAARQLLCYSPRNYKTDVQNHTESAVIASGVDEVQIAAAPQGIY